jgi:hypothetical protein
MAKYKGEEINTKPTEAMASWCRPRGAHDGRYFLSADVLTGMRFAGQLEGMDYQTATIDDMRKPVRGRRKRR